MEQKYHVLVVEDDKEIREGIEIYLRNQGYEVYEAANGAEGLKVVEREEIHLAIVDIMMPVMDGVTMLMKLRSKEYEFPVIMLSAKSEEVDKIMGLNMGADDYVTKPFSMGELTARVRSQLRRYTSLGDVNAAPEGVVLNGRLAYDPAARTLTADGEPVRLTNIETGIVDLLMRNLGRVFPAEEIYRRVWGEEAWSSEGTVMVHIRRIREKIELNPREPDYLKVVWGIGYKMEKK